MKIVSLGLAIAVALTVALPVSAQVTGRSAGGAASSAELLRNQQSASNTGIDSANIGSLQQAWKVDTEHPVTHAPLVRDGAVYFADWGGTVYCAEAASGNVVWKKKIESPNTKLPWHGFAGTGTIAGDLLIQASVEGRAFGIDRKDGRVVWEQRVGDEQQHAGNLSTLLHYDGLVYIGLSSPEEMLDFKKEQFQPNFQGKIIALNSATGQQVWELPLAKSPHNGAGVWSGFALDPATGVLFATTSNNYTGEANELSDAIVAINSKTGAVLWARQMTEHDVWTKEHPIGPDYAFGAMPQLFEAMVGGQSRELVGAGQKSGIYWAVDRRTGETVWSNVVGYGGIGGGIHAEAAIGDGRVYVWSNNSYSYGKPPGEYPMTIKCLDAATGKNLWALPKAQPASVPAAGFLAGDVYLVGSLDGKIVGYSAKDGKKLWTSPQTGGAIATSLEVDSGRLFFGTGVPKKFGGKDGGNAMVAFAPRT